MSKRNIKFFNKKPQNYRRELKKAIVIFNKSQKVVSSLHSVYLNLQKSRKSQKGLTEKETDVLRAMLVFAASGLDSVVKQLVRDTFLAIARKNSDVRKQLEKYIERKLKTRNHEGLDVVDLRNLSTILAAPSPFQKTVKLRIADLIAGSLQSKDELLKTASAFAIETKKICDDLEKLDEAFKIRNQIIHEMDINLQGSGNRRRPRSSQKMCECSNLMIKTASNYIEAIRNKLK